MNDWKIRTIFGFQLEMPKYLKRAQASHLYTSKSSDSFEVLKMVSIVTGDHVPFDELQKSIKEPFKERDDMICRTKRLKSRDFAVWEYGYEFVIESYYKETNLSSLSYYCFGKVCGINIQLVIVGNPAINEFEAECLRIRDSIKLE